MITKKKISLKKRKESKCINAQKSQITKDDSNIGRKDYKDTTNIQKIINEITIVGPYLSIITLNVNRLNSPVKNMTWLNGQNKIIQVYAVYKRLAVDLRTLIS